VARRGYDCAVEREWTAFVRICGDRPFLDPVAIDEAIEEMARKRDDPPDLVSNLLDGPVPVGLTVEVVRTEALGQALRESVDPQDREHLTHYLYANPHRFRLDCVPGPPAVADGFRFAVDTREDLQGAREVVERLGSP